MRIDMNVIVKNASYEKNKDLLPVLFGDNKGIISEPILEVGEQDDMYDILVKTGVYKSKTQARRAWVLTGKEVNPGFHDYQDIGRLRHRITLWNPI
jgi:hypothetical protein